MSAAPQRPSDPPHIGTAFKPAKTSPASSDAFRGVDAFVDAVWRKAAMAADGAGGPLRAQAAVDRSGAAQRRSWRFWCVAFCGMQMTRHRAVLRHSVRHALHPIARSDPARSVGAACSTGLIQFGGGLMRYFRAQVLSSSTAAPVIQRRLASGDGSMSRQENQGHQDPSRGRQVRLPAGDEMSRRPTPSMTARASSPCCISLPAAASRGPPWAISAIGPAAVQGWRNARHHHPTQRRWSQRYLHSGGIR